ncbi:MAG: hypothetical protein K8I30_20105, partial [Anaerolineae bacterium]|nr:hypothetical protein [Anaerolineae bacterium]
AVHPGYGNKYTKLVYSTRNPFNVGLDSGQPSLDNSLYLTENGLRGQREGVLDYCVTESGCLRTRYHIRVNGHQHTVDTTLIPLGDVHLRAHRITLDPDAGDVTAEEGSAALGYDAGAVPAIRPEQGWIFIAHDRNVVGLKPVEGYADAPQAVPGSPNSVYGFNLLATLTVPHLKPQHDLIGAVYAGGPPDASRLPTIERAGWEADGQFIARVNGDSIVMPALG